ncbi:MAG: formate--tetrahydrofolate ligase, partial [Armatimonadota bacterium]
MPTDDDKAPTNLEIAQAARLKPIATIAQEHGILPEELDLHGEHKTKVRLEILDRLRDEPNGKYILVTAVNPTPMGEGKTLTSVGLTQGLCRLGHRAMCCLREPSMGPVFGIKGGATGGGKSQILPMEDINLHFTGDIHATTAASNFLAGMIDASLWHDNPLGIDPLSITWRRVIDVNDVALRNVITGLGGARGGVPRETGFDMGVASEVHAVLALCTSISDLRKRLGRIRIGYTYDGQPVTADDLQAAGAMTALLTEAIKPNLVQTIEGAGAFVHCGPFANIAHGASSVLADHIALKLSDYVVTEAGFGADCGAEKFFNVKCRDSGLRCAASLIVASVRALKMHGGAFECRPGRPLPEEQIATEDLDALAKGAENLQKHVENMHLFGVPAVVAVNHFSTDTQAELELLEELATEAGADAVAISDAWAEGGAG